MKNSFLFTIDRQSPSLFQFNLPSIGFLKNIKIKNADYEMLGYFVGYDNNYSPEQLLKLVSEKGFSELINSNNEFVLILLEKRSKKLTVAVDQLGKFLIYFAVSSDKVVISNSFSGIKEAISARAKLEADLDIVSTSVFWDWHNTEKTLIKQIKKVPVGCIASFNLTTSSEVDIRSLVDIGAFDRREFRQYDKYSEYAKDWLGVLVKSTQKRVGLLKNYEIGCDLSSGLDCTLIAYCLKQTNAKFTSYSRYSSYLGKETDTEVMDQFAEFHQLRLRKIDVSSIYSRKFDPALNWSKDDPLQIQDTDYQLFLNYLKSFDVSAKFTGDGGDEVYGFTGQSVNSRFPQQNSFFNTLTYLKKLKLEKLFTSKFVDYSLSRDRFNARGYYPLIFPVSAVTTAWNLSEMNLNNGIYPVTPFLDTDVLSMARGIPHKEGVGKWDRKNLVAHELPQVFPEFMFVQKYGHEDTFVSFIRNNKEFISGVIKESRLGESGFIDRNNLLSMLNNPNSEVYTSEFAISLQSLVMLEWFFEKNNVIVNS